MNIPSDNTALSLTTTGAPDQIPFSGKKSNIALSSYEDDLASVYQSLGFSSSQSQSGPVSQAQTPTLEEPTVIMNPAMVMDLISSLDNKQSSQDLNSSIGMLRTNMSNEHVGIQKQIAQDQKIMKDAAAASKVSFWDKIFGWIGIAILDVVAVAANIVTVGGAVGLAVAAATATTMMALQQGGVIGDMTKAIVNSLEKDGCSPKEAQILGEVFTVAVVIAAVVLSSAGGAGLSSLVSSLSQAAETTGEVELGNMAELGEDVDQAGPDANQQLKMKAQLFSSLGHIATGILRLASAGLSTTSSVFTSDQLDDKAISLDWQAWVKENSQVVSTMQNQVKEMVQMIQQNTDTAAKAISNYSLAQEKVAQFTQV